MYTNSIKCLIIKLTVSYLCCNVQLTIAILAHSYFGSILGQTTHLRILAMAAQLIQEIENTTAYCKEKQLLNDTVCAPIARNFATGLIQQINNCLTLGRQEAVAVLEALKESAYEDADRKRIMASLEAKISSPHQGKTGARTLDQVLTNPWAVCTESDWVVFRNPKASFHTKMTRLVERLNLIGCTHPNVQTQRWMLAMLIATHYEEPPKPNEAYHKL